MRYFNMEWCSNWTIKKMHLPYGSLGQTCRDDRFCIGSTGSPCQEWFFFLFVLVCMFLYCWGGWRSRKTVSFFFFFFPKGNGVLWNLMPPMCESIYFVKKVKRYHVKKIKKKCGEKKKKVISNSTYPVKHLPSWT